MPSQEFLRECLQYDPDTGEIWWIMRPRHHFSSDGQYRRWNKLYAWKPAVASSHKFGHQQICLMGQNWLAHRLIWKWMTGEDPKEVDHRKDPTDNRWENLRDTDRVGNMRNRRLMRGTKTGFKGVCTMHESSRFGARIRVNGKLILLGTYATKEEAHAAYCEAAREHFGEFWNPG
jgi:hypothetical protein